MQNAVVLAVMVLMVVSEDADWTDATEPMQ